MRKILLILFALFILSPAFSNDTILSSCEKNFGLNADELYLLTLSILNGTGQFMVEEIQSKNGYILFSINEQKYIAQISKINSLSSNIKILSATSDYTKGTNVQKMVFDALNLNIKNTLKQVD